MLNYWAADSDALEIFITILKSSSDMVYLHDVFRYNVHWLF